MLKVSNEDLKLALLWCLSCLLWVHPAQLSPHQSSVYFILWTYGYMIGIRSSSWWYFFWKRNFQNLSKFLQDAQQKIWSSVNLDTCKLAPHGFYLFRVNNKGATAMSSDVVLVSFNGLFSDLKKLISRNAFAETKQYPLRNDF